MTQPYLNKLGENALGIIEAAVQGLPSFPDSSLGTSGFRGTLFPLAAFLAGTEFFGEDTFQNRVWERGNDPD